MEIRTTITEHRKGPEDTLSETSIITFISHGNIRIQISKIVEESYLRMLTPENREAAIKLYAEHNEFDAETELMEIGLEIARKRIDNTKQPNPIPDLV